MTQTEMTALRRNLIGGMHEYVKHLNDEDAYFWWIETVPDECDITELIEIADDKEMFIDVCNLFGKIVKRYGKYGESL